MAPADTFKWFVLLYVTSLELWESLSINSSGFPYLIDVCVSVCVPAELHNGDENSECQTTEENNEYATLQLGNQKSL